MIKICTHILKVVSKIRSVATQVNEEMKYLNVAEKNDAAKTIAGLLSNGAARRREGLSVYNKIYEFETAFRGSSSKMVMTSVSGHLMQLKFIGSYKGWNNCDPAQLFDASVRKQCNDDFLNIKKTLEKEIKSCQGLIIWTDCDREGENIGFEIIDVCKAINPNITVYRAKFSEITSTSVRRALANLCQPDKLQSDAVDVRTELDLRTGAAITRLQTMRLQSLFPVKIANKLISYGSCQIPTLGFVAERYKEVEAFISEPFWKIKVTHTIDDLTVDFNWSRNRLFNKESCEDYFLLVLGDPKATIENVNTKVKNKLRPIPMDTVEMEKLGSRKLKLSAKETMTIAEKLYTQGIISYPRTETNMFSKEIDLKKLVEHQLPHSVWGGFAQRVVDWEPNPRNGNKSDQAHPPIHPIKLVTNLSGNEGRVYELIVRHFLACVSKDATGSETVVNINIAGEKFSATGLCIHERNYLDVYTYEKWNSKEIHKYEIGQIFDPTEISMQEGATTAPPLLTEADLIALMEKHGIGTDATHAEHINTIKERGYIGVADRGCLVPGVIGMGLYEGYDAMELVLAKPMLRAEFEADLKKICNGQKDPKLVLCEQIQKYKEAYNVITHKIAAMDEKMSLRINETPRNETKNAANDKHRIQELFKCPKCRIAHMGLKKKKDSSIYYVGCLNFPDCRNVIWLPDEFKDVSLSQDLCKRCGTSKILHVKLKASYYRSLFDVPDGYYSTCFCCDSKFRETFNINADQVNIVGAIVDDAMLNTNCRTHTRSNQLLNPIAHKTQSSSSGARFSVRAQTNSLGYNSYDNSVVNISEAAKKTKHPIKPQDTTQKNVRKFSTDSRESIQIENNRQYIDDMHDFFESNDGYDDVLLNADLDNVNDQPGPISLIKLTNSNDSGTLFFDDDFEEYCWGTSGIINATVKTPVPKPPSLESLTFPIERSEGSYEWGSSRSQKSTREPISRNTANKGKPDYVGPKQKACGFLQWPDVTLPHEEIIIQPRSTHRTTVSAMSLPGTEFVNCYCQKRANRRIVRKDGPNKGRTFYACADGNKSCNFFQWSDNDSTVNQNKDAWRMNAVLSNVSVAENEPISNGRTHEGSLNGVKKRKCGICRQEGHTKLKCLYKNSVEI